MVTRYGIGFMGVLLSVSGPVLAVSFEELDTFETDRELWSVGGFGRQPLLQNESMLLFSSGGNAPNSRVVVFNKFQWAGNYNALGSNLALQMDLDPGSTPLTMRIAVGNTRGSWFLTNNNAAARLEADSGSTTVRFNLTSTDMVSVAGTDSLDTILSSVSELRILHRNSETDFRGDSVGANLLIDNIGFVGGPTEQETIDINQGMAGAWYNPETSGQGFVVDVEPGSQFMFVAWFTFSEGDSKLGAPEHRWLTASGNYADGSAELPIFLTTLRTI